MKDIRAIHTLNLLAACCVCLAGCITPQVNYRKEMRLFVKEISQYAKKNRGGFIVIPQNGQELAADSGVIHLEYLDAVDGTGREDLFYGYTGDNVETPVEYTDAMIESCNVFKTQGKVVLAIDYCSTPKSIDASYEKNERNGYISFAADERLLNSIPPYPAEPYKMNNDDIGTLGEARNFLYIINPERYASKESFISALAATNYDAVIIDLFWNGESLGKTDIERLKTKKNGGKRLVLCYMSIGEAEDYRYYWREEWSGRAPSWLKKEDPNWKGNFYVNYWDKEWKRIIYAGAESYLSRILARGFDGVYLDLIDAYEYFEQGSHR